MMRFTGVIRYEVAMANKKAPSSFFLFFFFFLFFLLFLSFFSKKKKLNINNYIFLRS